MARSEFSGLKALIVALGLVLVSVACGPPEKPLATLLPEYDSKTGKLRLLRYDTNADGHVDVWSYMDGARIVRIEIDKNEDNLIERWEHYGPANTLIKVGFSRKNDGIQDAWTYANPDGTVARIEVSTRRNGQVNRTEFYERNAMVRAEEDSDGDGRLDKWEIFENGRLSSVSYDTKRVGTPDRRVIHSPDGSAKLERLPGK